jgi:hypothetical protein
VNDTIDVINQHREILLNLNDNIRIREFLPILSKYLINLEQFVYHVATNHNIIIFKLLNGKYYITFKYLTSTQLYHKIVIKDITLQKLKLLLFHLFYDQIIY